jgi:multidrug efflux pump subunit AcrB
MLSEKKGKGPKTGGMKTWADRSNRLWGDFAAAGYSDLRPGGFAAVELTVGRRENALVIPEEALVPTRGGYGVFVVEDSTARWRQEAVMQWMRAQPEFVGVNADMKLDKPEVRVNIDRDMAGEMDVSVAAIANTLRYMFGDPQISTFDRQSERYDVITEIAAQASVPAVIHQLYVRRSAGRMVPLSALVTLEEGVGPSEIHHFNRMRAVTISSQVPPQVPLGTALAGFRAYARRNLPPAFETEVTGEAQDFQESFYYLTITLILAVVFIYLVMAGQFESFLHPFTILTTLPLAGLGVFGALYVFNMTFNIFAFIGLIMLVGLVTKTGILLVDYANVLVARGNSVPEAARQAARTRFRPVLMTASSTVLGMLPIALGFGAGGEARAAMGVVIALGNFVSTALILLVIPVVYVLLGGLQQKIEELRS